jgi:hypothetical protein
MGETVGSAKLRHFCLILSFVLCLTLVRCALSQESDSSTSAMCSIAQNPEKYDNKVVTVKARLISDGHHGSAIYDDSCSNFGMLLFVVPGAKGEEELDAAMNWCHPTTRGKLIFGTFSGVFHFKPGNPPGHSLSAQTIDGLVLKSTKTASAMFPIACPEAPPVDTLVRKSGHVDPAKPQ